ncbi:MAG: DNA mismatch repair endonuclease MutL [Candidatus Dormibacteria bacterium]
MNRGALPGGRIRVLDPMVAEAIAAGEVIDRPAAAVKELVENALDAGARRVEVEIEGGGADLIRVVDDGSGMAPAELEVAFHRHATSKLIAIEDLERLRTFGFRGEALASVAAVSRVTVVSRAGEGGRAYSLAIEGEQRRGPSVTSAAVGTAITARDLFHSLPARRAFLRSPRAEAAACTRIVADAALSRPDVKFQLRSQGRRVFSSSGSGSLAEAVTAVFGQEPGSVLLKVAHADQEMTLNGLIGAPEVARPTRQGMVAMVNGRRIHHRGIEAAISAAYRGILPADRFPLAVLDIGCDPALVDVNVHPAKREVRFRDERAVFELVQRGCWTALQGVSPRSFPISPATTGAPGQMSEQLPIPQFIDAGAPVSSGEAGRAPSLTDLASWIFVGQAHERYLVAQTASGLAVIDQHAAHEKVLYQRWLAELRNDSRQPHASQGLLDPVLIETETGALDQATDAGMDLLSMGFHLEQFGETTVRCSAAPVELPVGAIAQAVLELLEIAAHGGPGEADRWHRVAASLACHSAIRFGDRVGEVEASTLLKDLAATEGGITCPHGRPAVLLLSESQLLTAFQRR